MLKLYTSFVCLFFTVQLFSQALDTQFGENGKIFPLIETGYRFKFERLFVQSDNKIVAFQNKQPEGGYLQSGYYITRYNANGVKDSGFGSSGSIEVRHLLNVPESEYIYGIKILQQPDKKLLAVIRRGNQNSAIVENFSIRLNINGSIDSTYGTNGVSIVDVGEIVTINDADLQGEKLILGGFSGTWPWTAEYSVLTRITENGNMDAGFGDNGMLKTRFWKAYDYEYMGNLVVDRLTQAIFCTGETYPMDDDGYAYLAKCTPDGKIDLSFPIFFGDPGIDQYSSRSYGVDISPDHQFVCFAVKAIGKSSTYDRDYVWRVKMDGKADSSFGKNGRAEINWQVLFNTMRFSDDNQLYFSGQVSHESERDLGDAAVTGRMHQKGHRDHTYGEDGVTRLYGENYIYSNNFDFHKRPGSNRGLVLSVSSSDSSFIIRYHDAPGNKLSESNISAAIVAKDPVAFKVYPNPVRSTLYVSLHAAAGKSIQINITGISGKQFYTGKIIASGAGNTHAINVNRLPAGTYLLAAITEDGITTSRFVKE